MEELGRLHPDALKSQSPFPVRIVLDNVRSMHNVGAIFRSADCFRAEGILLCGMTPKPPHRDIQKSALGATETVAWTYEPDTVAAVDRLKAEGYALWAVEQTHNSTALQEYNSALDQPLALIFGNEVAGVSDDVLARCKGSLEIPQWGSKHSFNIAVSVGIVLWEIMRKQPVRQAP